MGKINLEGHRFTRLGESTSTVGNLIKGRPEGVGHHGHGDSVHRFTPPPPSTPPYSSHGKNTYQSGKAYRTYQGYQVVPRGWPLPPIPPGAHSVTFWTPYGKRGWSLMTRTEQGEMQPVARQ